MSASLANTKSSDYSTKRSLSESSAEDLSSQQKQGLVSRNTTTAINRSVSKNMCCNELKLNGNSSRASALANKRLHSAAAASGTTQKANTASSIWSSSHVVSDILDISIRVMLTIVFIFLETSPAFKRKIHEEEMWLYKNPRAKDIVSPTLLILAVVFGPLLSTLVYFMLTHDRRDFRAASWTWTLILGLNGLVTSLLKITVGRPRPDFYYRCFPDGILVLNQEAANNNNGTLEYFSCTGIATEINEGRKSFPSGHASFAFAGFGFLSFYVGAKLHAFTIGGRGQSWRMFIALAPLFGAALVAVSRTCDYHHHWQDVFVGSIIGITVSYFVYRQYYPSIFAPNCHKPYYRGNKNYYASNLKNSAIAAAAGDNAKIVDNNCCSDTSNSKILQDKCCEQQDYEEETDYDEQTSLIANDKKDNKWF